MQLKKTIIIYNPMYQIYLYIWLYYKSTVSQVYHCFSIILLFPAYLMFSEAILFDEVLSCMTVWSTSFKVYK